MAKSKKHSNIAIFVPHVGCPHRCAFCDQRTITGENSLPRGADVKAACEQALREVSSPEDTEIAFFGGSFTAIPRSYMLELLEAASSYIGEGKFKGIRLSTRPDYIDSEVLRILKSFGVTAIELGAQSMDETVLSANERGHTAADVERAAKLIRAEGFELGLQMMIGLYKSTRETEYATFERLCALGPATLRLYPTVIIKGTRLAELFEQGEYKTFEFDEVVGMCAGFLARAEEKGIRVIKCGLHASEFVQRDMVGGFYHPAFRELCEGVIYREKIEKLILEKGLTGEVTAAVALGAVSKAVGQRRANAEYFGQRGIKLKIKGDSSLEGYGCIIADQ